MEYEKKVGIYGFGTMGSSIAIAALENGFNVIAYDVNVKSLESGRERAKKYFQKNASLSDTHKAVSEELDTRLTTVSQPDFPNCFIIIESVFENRYIKKNVFKRLSATMSPDVILATNTSSIPISEISELSEHKERIIGLHFANPPYKVKGAPGVEVIMSAHTSETTFQRTMEFAISMGLKPDKVALDKPGFVGNVMLGSMILMGLRLLQEGETVETIENICKNHLAWSYGPFFVVDLIGVDVVVHFLEEISDRFPDFAPHPILISMLEKGWLGRKTGKGFYEYSKR